MDHALLVGHSWGGTVITEAGTDYRAQPRADMGDVRTVERGRGASLTDRPPRPAPRRVSRLLTY